jgi:integrase
MHRKPLIATIVGITVLTILLDFWTSAELFGSVLFTFPLVLCVMQRSRWLLWSTAALATLLSAATGMWAFHRVELLNPWVAAVNRGLLVANLLALTTLIHSWITKSDKMLLEAGNMERQSKSLITKNERLEQELLKIKTAAKGKGKPLVLTIKQYQAFAAQLSDLHRTMVVAAMCTGLRVAEVLALRWDQLEFTTHVISLVHGQSGETKSEIPMDPVLAETFLEWRNKGPGTGLVFPSHITGRCYHAGPIQQNYFRPVARKLSLVGVCWHTFPNSYRIWMDEEGVAGVQQKLMRPANVSTAKTIRSHAPLKAKAKTKRESNGKVASQFLPTVGFHAGASTEAP